MREREDILAQAKEFVETNVKACKNTGDPKMGEVSALLFLQLEILLDMRDKLDRLNTTSKWGSKL